MKLVTDAIRMKRIIIIMFLITAWFNGKAQFKFPGDSVDYNPYAFEFKIDSVFNLKSSNEFELRLIVRPSLLIPGAKRTLFLMTQNHHRWQARLFQYSNYPKDQFWEIPVDTTKLNELWAMLMKQNILKIKEAYLLKDEQGEIARTNMKDGITYTFRLISKNAKRSYSYYSPRSAMEDYPKIKQFKQVTKMIDCIKNYCSLKNL